MSVAEFRGGWSPTPPARPRVRLTSSLRADVAPPQTNFGAGVPVIGWHLNDQWGCCTCAADANLVQQQTFFGQGSEASVADAEVLKAYEAVGNFNPAAGQPGQNPTDQGALIPDALGYLKNTGMLASDGAVHKIAAYGQIDVTQLAKLKTAIWEFGCLSVGINLPNSAIQQFNAGQDWDVAANDGGNAGGHCVLVVGYDSVGYLLFTWDKLIHMTYAFAAKYMEEAWAPVSQDWVNRTTGKDPEGVDLATLGQEFQAVTGANPFPKPPGPAPVPPGPAPVPPGPAPAPVPPAPANGGCLPFGRVLGRVRRRHH